MPSTMGGITPPAPDVPVPRADEYARMRLASNLKAAAHGDAGNIVFLGDSIIEYWTSLGRSSWTSAIAPLGAADFGIKSNETVNLLSQIEAGELMGRPKVVVLMIGTNDIQLGRDAAWIAQAIAANLASIRKHSPRSKIVIMGILPEVGPDSGTFNQTASTVNTAISRFANGRSVYFLNINKEFMFPGGTANPAMFHGLLHPGAQGYSAWARAIAGILAALSGHRTTSHPASPLR